jgi:hypothetical protein
VLRFPLLDPENGFLIEIIQGRIIDHVLALRTEYYAELGIDACV